MRALLAPFRAHLPHFTIRHILLLITASLTLMITLLLVGELYANAVRLNQSYDLRKAISVGDELFVATDKISVERDLALAMLQATDSEIVVELQPLLADSRRQADEAVALALADFNNLPNLADLRQSLVTRWGAILDLRPRIDAALANPRRARPAALTADWEQTATALTSDAERLWIEFVRPHANFDARLTQHLRYRHFLRTITDYTGRERSIIGQILSENADPTLQQTSDLLRGQGVLEISWSTSRLLAEQSGLYNDIAPFYSDAASHYATLQGMLREFYVPGARLGGGYPIGPDIWFELSSQASESLTALLDASRVATRAYLDNMIARTERSILAQSMIFLIAISLCAGSFWMILARVIGPINRIVNALTRATRGESVDFVTDAKREDEIGKLSDVLQAFQDNVEKVRRTAAELDVSTNALRKEAVVRRSAEEKTQAQLERLALLHQISRAIGERQYLDSIFQVAAGNVEERLPADFVCICTHDPAENVLTIAQVAEHSEERAANMAMLQGARLEVAENGLARCVAGALIYEPNTDNLTCAFSKRFADAGLKSFVGAPLQVESQFFGVLFAARRRADGFTSAECEFLRQLSEHIALAAHQAQLNAALQQAYDDLRQTQDAVMQQERLRALGQMASGIAHDINNALSPVALYTESLLATEKNLSPAGRGKLEIVQRAIDDAARTIARMNEFYRRRDTQLALSPVKPEALLQQVLDLTQARWRDMPQEQGNVFEMRTEFADNLPPILGVESELREALTNLVFNAVDAMPDGGRITLRVKMSPPDAAKRRMIQIEVADSGIGMDEDTRQRCLEPFFTTKGERGTGLGLAMVYGVVQRHGGNLEIDSTLGQGTIIRLSLAAASHGATAASAPEAAAPTSRLRLLLVDDDPILLRSLRDVLEGDGHVITTASDGASGIATFKSAHDAGKFFDAVITDLGMPRIDGRRVASSVKEISPSTPVILLTGWGERLRAEEETIPHMDRILSKPPRLADLRLALAQCCAPVARARSM